MKDTETRNKFVELRAQGWSYDRIAKELKVAKSALIEWSRLYASQIHNLRVVETEAIMEKYLASKEDRLRALGLQLEKIGKELAGRDLSTVSTARLIELDARLRREMEEEFQALRFRGAEEEIPSRPKPPASAEWAP